MLIANIPSIQKGSEYEISNIHTSFLMTVLPYMFDDSFFPTTCIYGGLVNADEHLSMIEDRMAHSIIFFLLLLQYNQVGGSREEITKISPN